MTSTDEPAKERRAYGQGSLHELSPGVWRMRVYVGRDPITGKLVQPNRRFRGTRAAAEKELMRFRAELEAQPAGRGGATTRTTLNDVIDAHLAASDDLAPGTRRTYTSLFHKHIEPGFGRSPVAKLTAHGFRTYYRRLANETGLSDSSIWSTYSLISGAIKRAQREQGLRFDRNQLVTPRKADRPDKELLTDDELRRVFHVAGDLGDDWALLIRVLLATGMRRGEAAALRWSSLGDDDVLSVVAGAVDEIGGIVEKSTKTGNRRRLVLDATTSALWRERRAIVASALESGGLSFHDELYVFSNDPERLVPRRPDLLSKKWAVIRRRAKVADTVELRSLRNWNITVLREHGFPLEFIGARVGHEGRGTSPLAMTASYTVSRREQDQAMAATIESKLAEVSQ